jgi:two-component system response regulator
MMMTAGRVMSVLLVDDDEGDLLMIQEALDSGTAAHEIHVAHDGQEALDFLRRKGSYADAPRPDLVLLDLNMPRMDGRQVLAAVKVDEELRKIPIVVLTTSRAPADIASSYDLHANAYVTKPMSLDDLTAVVKGIDDFFSGIADLPRS